MKKVAFSTGAFYTLETADALSRIRKAGFGHAELMPQCSEDLSPVMLKKANEIGIHISSIHYPLVFFGILYNANPGMFRQSKAFSDNLANFARAAGTEFVVIHPEEEYKAKFQQILGKPINDNIRYLCDALEDKGITVAMENYPTGVGQYPDTLDAYVDALRISNMKVMVDTTEVIEGGGDPLEFISGLKEVPCHLHLSDYKDNVKHIPIGTGKVDWKAVTTLLKDRGFEGYWTLEPSYKYYLDDPDGQLKRDYDYLTALV
ncbi:MAG: sugar phosphate isomerase/epimerase [Spirochaetales bacterium]|nr:sugar phosphate isomerase/epimerase [Spirochaetales bacterium]